MSKTLRSGVTFTIVVDYDNRPDLADLEELIEKAKEQGAMRVAFWWVEGERVRHKVPPRPPSYRSTS